MTSIRFLLFSSVIKLRPSITKRGTSNSGMGREQLMEKDCINGRSSQEGLEHGMMDTDTACARQKVMLCSKHRGDTKLSRRQRDKREGEGKRAKLIPGYSTHTHHPRLERRCLNKDNPRVDPVCTW